MSEFAEKCIQEMIPELKQMEKLGLFTHDEIRKLVKKRRALEYKLRRKTKELNDYLQYIAYEEQVLLLLKNRRQRNKCTLMRKQIDVCIIKRIHKLFQLACERFPECIDLWLKHIKFCHERKEMSSIGNLYAKALKVHPHSAALWIMAAKFEMEDGMSMSNARSLLLNSLRFNSGNQQLYLEYFRMELLNAEQLRKRKEVLNLEEIEEVCHGDSVSQPDFLLLLDGFFPTAYEVDNYPIVEIDSMGRLPTVVYPGSMGTLTESSVAMLNGKMAEFVYKDAMKTVPGDVDFCLAFIPICQIFSFTGWLEDEIYADLKVMFPGNEKALASVARRSLTKILNQPDKSERIPAECIQETFNCFDNSLEEYPSESLWELYLDTCLEIAKVVPSSKRKDMVISHGLNVCLHAADQQMLTEKMALSWVDMLMKTGQSQFALDVSPLLVQKFRHSVPLWVHRLRLLVVCGEDAETILSQLKDATKILDQQEDVVQLWQLVVEWCTQSCPDKLIDLLEAGLMSRSKSVCLYAKECYIDWAAINQNIEFNRKLYRRLASMQPSSVALLYKYVDIELSQSVVKMKKVRHAYDLALLNFGSSDVDIWLNYMKLESSNPSGKAENVGLLYQKAIKCLDGTLENDFIDRYTIMNTARN